MKTKVTKLTKATFTFHNVDGPLWWRIKMAVSLLLSPLSIILVGHSIRVDYSPEMLEEAKGVDTTQTDKLDLD